MQKMPPPRVFCAESAESIENVKETLDTAHPMKMEGYQKKGLAGGSLRKWLTKNDSCAAKRHPIQEPGPADA
jgi:hypothetical protein